MKIISITPDKKALSKVTFDCLLDGESDFLMLDSKALAKENVCVFDEFDDGLVARLRRDVDQMDYEKIKKDLLALTQKNGQSNGGA